MAKTQNYTIEFNTTQTDVESAMYSIGGVINDDVRQHVQSEILLGNINPGTQTLSDDGLVLTVSRTWTDSAYSELLAIMSEDEITTAINNMEHVSSATYGFSDT